MKIKKYFIFILMIFAMTFSLYAKSKTMYVCVKKAQLKTSTAYFAKACGQVRYADEVKVMETKGKWARVGLMSRPSVEGWIALKSLTRKKLIKKKKSSSASTDELALAGKGLTEGTGNEFKTKGNRNYRAVNTIESMDANNYQLKAFIDRGKLKDGE